MAHTDAIDEGAGEYERRVIGQLDTVLLDWLVSALRASRSRRLGSRLTGTMDPWCAGKPGRRAYD